jgi:hypothetical protein
MMERVSKERGRRGYTYFGGKGNPARVLPQRRRPPPCKSTADVLEIQAPPRVTCSDSFVSLVLANSNSPMARLKIVFLIHHL